METLLQDIRYGFRSMLKAPGFTAIALVALALGIGANTAMFSIVNAVLLRPAPYPEPQRLMKIYTSMPQFKKASVSYPNFLDWQRRSRSFEQMAAYRTDSFNLTGQANPERLRGEMASSTLFSALDLHAIVGRTFSPAEDERGAGPVAVLTAPYWKSRFGGSTSIIGSAITLNDKLYTVIGVVPGDDVMLRRISVIIPIGQWSEPLFWDRGVGMGMNVVARLKPGVSEQQAQAELNSIAEGLAREFPKENKNRGITAVSLTEDLTGEIRRPLLVLLAAVGFVLLIACVNVANLLLARSTARRREFAIRGALGAKRSRIVRQLLTEALLLAACGGVLGLAVAYAVESLLAATLANLLPRADQIHLDGSVLFFTAVISILASVLFGITPATQSARSDLNETLKEAGRGNTGRHGLQRALAVVEVALALVLTASAGLMIRTMSHLWSVSPGFDPHNVLTFSTAGSAAVNGTPEQVRNGFAETTRRLLAVPGIASGSLLFGSLPMQGDSELPYWVEGRPKPAEQSQMDMALFYGVEPGYFSAMRIPLLHGRLISDQDNEHSPCAIDIDQDLAQKAFPGQDAIGQHLNLELLPMQCEIVGIVGHIKHWGLDADATSKVHSQMYVPYRQFPDSVMNLASHGGDYVVRTTGDPYSVVPELKRVVGDINGKMVLYNPESMQDVINDSLAARRYTRMLLVIFAALALVLAAVGIYGVVSYAVSQSTHEIGVRMALGADRRRVLAMVLSGALRMALIGIAVGAAGALLATQVMKGLLYGVSAADPVTFAGVAAVLVIVTLIASYVPAHRAMKVDPMIALRCE
jgi:predicted permease